MIEPPPRDLSLALALQGIGKRFGSTQALAAASLQVRPGTVHALLGENGAGKSTLMRIAYGLTHPDAGTISVHGATVRLTGPADAIARGIGMVHQHFTLVPVMTVAENVALGGHGVLKLSHVASQLRELSARTGFALNANARVESLSIAAQQRVEIAKALVRDARLLVLDEPTAVLPPSESSELLRWLREFADEGNAVVLITHKLHEALLVADDVTVLRRGRTVLTALRADTTVEALTNAMLGVVHTEVVEAEQSTSAARTESSGPAVFQAEAITVVDVQGVVRMREASFEVAAGEIVGVAGIEGSGQHELLRALAGRLPVAAGTLRRPGNVGFVPEDRHRDAVLLERPLVENVALRGAGVRRGVMDWRHIEARTASLVHAFDVRGAGTQALIRTLSGGNQQKLVLARELTSDDADTQQAIVVENPTRGLDVRATTEVHARLRAARDAGAAVILYSSDIDEVLQLADRVLVTYAGVVRAAPLDREIVGRLMLGLDGNADA